MRIIPIILRPGGRAEAALGLGLPVPGVVGNLTSAIAVASCVAHLPGWVTEPVPSRARAERARVSAHFPSEAGPQLSLGGSAARTAATRAAATRGEDIAAAPGCCLFTLLVYFSRQVTHCAQAACPVCLCAQVPTAPRGLLARFRARPVVIGAAPFVPAVYF